METSLVSIIIPVYNVEKYLDRCVQSVFLQSYKNLEIILIDDGSPDSCPRLCDEYGNIDKRVRVLHKKNEGLGLARNSGLALATGKYVLFIDSDDYLSENMVEKLVCQAEFMNADIVYCIIRKTKCFRILERNAKISKTKRNFSRLYPTPQKFKKIDRLRRNEIHLKAVRTPS